MDSSGKWMPLPQEGFVRLNHFLGPGRAIPIGGSTWWPGVKSGCFPQSVRLGRRITVWRVMDIRDLIERGWK
jgi:prophage regulatory protein